MTSGTTSRRQRRMARQAQSDASTPRRPDQTVNPAGAPEKRTRSNGSGKIDAVFALLRREGGATLDEVIKLTGWLPHSARAALTGLRKKGHAIERSKVDGISHYAIVGPVAQ